jgi:hypothetical protein
MADLKASLEKLAAKFDSVANTPSKTFTENLSSFKLNTRTQASLHNLIGPEATRAGMAGVRTAGKGLEAAGSLFGSANNFANQTIKQSAVGAMGSAGSTMGDIGGKLMGTGNPMAMAAGAFLKVGGAALEAVGKIKEWGDALHEDNRALAQFSGSMAAVMAQDDARRIQLDRSMGEERAASAKNLADGRYRLDAALAPIENAFANLKNKVIGNLERGLAKIIETITGGADPTKPITPGSQQEGHQWLADIDVLTLDIEHRRPQNMR